MSAGRPARSRASRRRRIRGCILASIRRAEPFSQSSERALLLKLLIGDRSLPVNGRDVMRRGVGLEIEQGGESLMYGKLCPFAAPDFEHFPLRGLRKQW